MSGVHNDGGGRADQQRSHPDFVMELQGIKKSFAQTEVLHGVDLRVAPGRIHALLGANGAGKSTLLKIADGAVRPSAGKIRLHGEERKFANTVEAREAGIAMVFQERSVLGELSVVDNVFLNDEVHQLGLIDGRSQEQIARELFDRLGVNIPPRAKVRHLGVADQQMVEIAKALRKAETLLILDEPTAALTEQEVGRLFAVLRQLAQSGLGIVYVSHRLGEVFELCDDITVLRDGRVAMCCPTGDTSMDAVVEAMVGRPIRRDEQPDDATSERRSETLLAVRELEIKGKLSGVNFEVTRGEILGVAGLAGSGRSVLLKALFGIVRRSGGTVTLNGATLHPRSPAQAIRKGVYLIPEDRKSAGLVLNHTVESNLVLSSLAKIRRGLWIDRRRSKAVANKIMADLQIKAGSPATPVRQLSGGNQQKVVLGKAFSAGGTLLLLDEPTFGVDVNAAQDITQRVRDFVAQGNAAIWVTSDLQELIRVSDRILVLKDGRANESVDNRPVRQTEAQVTHLIQPTFKQAG